MPEILFGDWDPVLTQIADVLSRYEEDHPEARVSLYRQNSASVRIRIIDPIFSSINKMQRDKEVWPLLRTLPDDVQSEITILLLLTPDETKSSIANFDFDQPIPSTL